ncbi:hypothetical protein ES707_09635 [subsurface metagenome]|jgi:hypothetical protein
MAYEGDADDVSESGRKANGTSSLEGISPVLAGWFGIGLAVLALLALVVMSSFSSRDSLGYAALAGTAILSVGLIALIVLSRAVGVIEPSAALGLPRGSIRALLALGLAIVFVSVASWTLGGLLDPVGSLVTEATVKDDSERKVYWDRYPASEYIVRESVKAPSSTSVAPAKSGPAADNAAKDAPKDAKDVTGFPKELKIYLKRPGMDQGVLDLAKQILTISATVLVTIVGFYFGSNASAEAARTVGAIMSGSMPGATPYSASKGGPAGSEDLSRLSNTIAAISSGCASRLQSFGADPMSILREAVAGASADSELTRKLQEAEQLYIELKAKSSACEVDTARAKEAMDGLPSSPSQAQLLQANERLKQLRTEAEQVNQEFEQKLAQFADARQYILTRTAKG